ncbi:MAG: 2-oxo acid dehydrogenase subunit E2 [Anaerolineales bacterium]|nr:2-oxo acid dehydrogenase subunit E2 [Anaerolineales bacterium]
MAEIIKMPKLGFDMAEGTLVRWLKKEGETVTKGEVLAEIETDKATVEVEASVSGVVRKLLVDEGAVVPVNTPIAIVGAADEVIEAIGEKVSASNEKAVVGAQPSAPSPKLDRVPAPVTEAVAPLAAGLVKASPLAKRIARERGLDLSRIQGSGPGGRIVRRDIEKLIREQFAVIGEPSSVSRPPSGEGETVPLTKLRQAIARRMSEAKSSVPHFYITHEYKMDTLIALRAQINAYLPESEKLSVNDFIIRAVALALREFPNLNASFAGDKVVRHGVVNIGVAVAVEGGLLTVVCKDADQKPLRQIAAEVKRMVAGAREGKVKPEDIEGSTFSISNLGMFDVENFAAIINPPEAAILAVGSARQVPVVEDGQIQIGWRMKATISVDHRVSDGAEAAQFMQTLAKYLEEPIRLLV